MQSITIVSVSMLVTGLIEVLKRTKGLSFLEGRFDLVALILAIVISLAGGLDIVSGLIAGLTAQGFYDTVKKNAERIL